MTKHIEIENIKGFILRGYLELPENAKRIVCMFHGFTGNKTILLAFSGNSKYPLKIKPLIFSISICLVIFNTNFF